MIAFHILATLSHLIDFLTFFDLSLLFIIFFL